MDGHMRRTQRLYAGRSKRYPPSREKVCATISEETQPHPDTNTGRSGKRPSTEARITNPVNGLKGGKLDITWRPALGKEACNELTKSR